jgi:hypothetical protein
MAGSIVTIAASQMHKSDLHIREIDAARALLGVKPSSESANLPNQLTNPFSRDSTLRPIHAPCPIAVESFSLTTHGFKVDPLSDVQSRSAEDSKSSMRRQRSDSSGLETLAAIAEREQLASTHRPLPSFLRPGWGSSTISTSSSEATPQYSLSDSSPPPPPLRCVLSRQRSVSNPEGMEKWDSLLSRSSRRHFVLPASILEEELAEANEAVRLRSKSPVQVSSIPEHGEFHGEFDLLPTIDCEEKPTVVLSSPEMIASIEEDITADELLRRARSRLLDDLSSEICSVTGEKGMPHSLAKYNEVRTWTSWDMKSIMATKVLSGFSLVHI